MSSEVHIEVPLPPQLLPAFADTTPLKLLCAVESKSELASPTIATSKLAEYAMVGAVVGAVVAGVVGAVVSPPTGTWYSALPVPPVAAHAACVDLVTPSGAEK